jgi:hypothetical protein
MSWRHRLHVEFLESADKSDKTLTFVTSVTSSVNTNDEVSSDVRPEPPKVDCDFDSGIPWVNWKARALNQLFTEQGITGAPGRITAATIRHGETGHKQVDSAETDERPMSRAEATE